MKLPGGEITRASLSHRPRRVGGGCSGDIAKGRWKPWTRPVGPRYTWHAPAKLPVEAILKSHKPKSPPSTPGQVACSFVLNTVAGQLDDDGNKQQELEAAEDKKAIGGGRADGFVVDLVYLTFIFYLHLFLFFIC